MAHDLSQGDLLVLISAALYAMKGVVYKRWFGREDGGAPSRPHTPMCDGAVTVGLMGFWSVLIGGVILVLAHASGVEPFSWPPPRMLAGYCLVALMMTAYMACLLAALAYSTPTFVAVVSLFVTPVTLLWDLAAGRARSLTPLALCGMALLICALLAVIFHDSFDLKLRRYGHLLVAQIGLARQSRPLLHEHQTVGAAPTGDVLAVRTGVPGRDTGADPPGTSRA